MIVELRNSDRLPTPRGFSHASIAGPGRVVHLAGVIGTDIDGNFAEGLANQTQLALANLLHALAAAGGTAEHLVKTTMYVVGWKESMQPELFAGIIAAAQEAPLPQVPTTLVGIQSLFLDAALIEIDGVAVLPA